jgi:hypothetical protein
MSTFGNSTHSAFGFAQPKPQSHSVFGSSQPATTDTISGQQNPIMVNSGEQIEESKAIIAALMKIETITHDWRKNLTRLGISEDLESEKQYIKYIKIYTNLIEENIEKKIHSNRAKFLSILERLNPWRPSASK